MEDYQRRLPQWHPRGEPLFITWRLYGSLPVHRSFPKSSVTSGEAFVAMDRLLEQCQYGPLHLSRPKIAQIVVNALFYGQDTLGKPFWQEESYDHVVRNEDERQRIRNYIEQNPVRAGLASSPEGFRWSSASKGAGLEAGCGPGGPPYKKPQKV